MEEVKFFVLPFPLKTKTKKKILHDHEFAHFADFPTVASFRLTAVLWVNSACTIFYYLFFILSNCFNSECFVLLRLVSWAVFCYFTHFLVIIHWVFPSKDHLPLSSLLFISLQKNLPFQRNQIVSSWPSIRFNFLHKGFLFLCF